MPGRSRPDFQTVVIIIFCVLLVAAIVRQFVTGE
jgi:hypothetical protein